MGSGADAARRLRAVIRARWSWIERHTPGFRRRDEVRRTPPRDALGAMAPHGGKRGSFKVLEEAEVTTGSCQKGTALNARIVRFLELVIAETDGRVVQNSLAYCVRSDGVRLMSEVIPLRGHWPTSRCSRRLAACELATPWSCGTRCFRSSWGRVARQDLRRLQNPLPELARLWLLPPAGGLYPWALLDHQWILPQWPSRVTSSWRGPAGTVPEGELPTRSWSRWPGAASTRREVTAGPHTVEHEIAVLAARTQKALSRCRDCR